MDLATDLGQFADLVVSVELVCLWFIALLCYCLCCLISLVGFDLVAFAFCVGWVSLFCDCLYFDSCVGAGFVLICVCGCCLVMITFGCLFYLLGLAIVVFSGCV